MLRAGGADAQGRDYWGRPSSAFGIVLSRDGDRIEGAWAAHGPAAAEAS